MKTLYEVEKEHPISTEALKQVQLRMVDMLQMISLCKTRVHEMELILRGEGLYQMKVKQNLNRLVHDLQLAHLPVFGDAKVFDDDGKMAFAEDGLKIEEWHNAYFDIKVYDEKTKIFAPVKEMEDVIVALKEDFDNVVNGVPYELTSNDKVRKAIIKRLSKTDGVCPCHHEEWDENTPKIDKVCPCKTFRETGECHCGLYVKKGE